MENWGKIKKPMGLGTLEILAVIRSAGLAGIKFVAIVDSVVDNLTVNPKGCDRDKVKYVVSSAIQSLKRNRFIVKEEKVGGLLFITEAGIQALDIKPKGPSKEIMGGIDSKRPIITKPQSIQVAIRQILVESPGLTTEQIVIRLNVGLWDLNAVTNCLKFSVQNGQRCFYRRPGVDGWFAK